MVELIVDEQPNQRDHVAGLREDIGYLAKRTHSIYNLGGKRLEAKPALRSMIYAVGTCTGTATAGFEPKQRRQSSLR
ncbi:hypothetical protein [Cryobacterium sp. TMT1-66-1]|uniref:hypothetical protein n=1 Tax=Cryobacterium sp. TMT1-66-1 TaxID=1259242 RepID=UPI00106DA57C|nr:hypothetical protein [Cryobacterium sp. TMT1-66-1]TFD07536.1 hypothetical protein E3T29_06485 [Cryobacterium sp. TMT1-66-1]